MLTFLTPTDKFSQKLLVYLPLSLLPTCITHHAHKHYLFTYPYPCCLLASHTMLTNITCLLTPTLVAYLHHTPCSQTLPVYLPLPLLPTCITHHAHKHYLFTYPYPCCLLASRTMLTNITCLLTPTRGVFRQVRKVRPEPVSTHSLLDLIHNNH